MQGLLEKPRLITKNLTATIRGLEHCSSYFIAVGVLAGDGASGTSSGDLDSSLGTLGARWAPGPLSTAGSGTLDTPYDPKAPVRDLKATVVETNGVVNRKGLLITWKPSCDVITQPVGYVAEIIELTTNETFRFELAAVSNRTLSHLVEPVLYGANYRILVRTSGDGLTSKGPAADSEITVQGPPLPVPHQLQMWRQRNSSFLVQWKDVKMPDEISSIKFKYVLWVSTGKQVDTKTGKNYTLSESTLILDSLEEGQIYSMAVQIQTEQGMLSELSEVESIQVPLGTWSLFSYDESSGNGGSTWRVAAPVLILVTLAVCTAAAVLVWRHRRAQNSFTRFANSHYDTRTGATTIGAGGVLDDDVPDIRPFSDDEPLVLA
ncbi:sortilin-related receptor-like [Ctenocephalides felis]|uniref:sortilin-related receptor-like n=1 Tax=Ctenocephalides felis TaxID=7515 RepID=UPI000E6E266B|nr:sortilin-related receptor-like [Ctenocephalides felis]